MEEKHKEYGMFNGRRNADNYVKGYLKGIAIISGIGLTIFMSFVGWVVFENRKNATSINNHEVRISVVETVHESFKGDLDEIKSLLRRAAPYEIRPKN